MHSSTSPCWHSSTPPCCGPWKPLRFLQLHAQPCLKSDSTLTQLCPNPDASLKISDPSPSSSQLRRALSTSESHLSPSGPMMIHSRYIYLPRTFRCLCGPFISTDSSRFDADAAPCHLLPPLRACRRRRVQAIMDRPHTSCCCPATQSSWATQSTASSVRDWSAETLRTAPFMSVLSVCHICLSRLTANFTSNQSLRAASRPSPFPPLPARSQHRCGTTHAMYADICPI